MTHSLPSLIHCSCFLPSFHSFISFFHQAIHSFICSFIHVFYTFVHMFLFFGLLFQSDFFALPWLIAFVFLGFLWPFCTPFHHPGLLLSTHTALVSRLSLPSFIEEDDVKACMRLFVLGFGLACDCSAAFLSFSSPLSTNRRRPNWSMPTLRSSNRAFSLKRPKLINSRGS